jgi:transketolase
MDAPSVFVFTHDSVGVGEDGPTHQPVEHIMSLRLIPNLAVWRPADAYETFYSWEAILTNRKPACLLLSRQKLPILGDQKDKIRDGVKRGAYTIKGPALSPDLEIIATGSEVCLALEAALKLEDFGIRAKVVSMPCYEVFMKQDEVYRSAVITPNLPKVCIEAGKGMGWKDITGGRTLSISIETFGHSAPAEKVFASFGFTAGSIVEKIKTYLGK